MKLIDKYGLNGCREKFEKYHRTYCNLETTQKPKDIINYFINFCNAEIQTKSRIEILNTKVELTNFWNTFVNSEAIVNTQVFYNALLQEVDAILIDYDNGIWTEV